MIENKYLILQLAKHHFASQFYVTLLLGTNAPKNEDLKLKTEVRE